VNDSKEIFLLRKKIAIAKLVAKADPIMSQLSNDPEFEKAIQDRLEHIERGELWITPAAAKYAPMIMQLDQIRCQIANISATTWDDHKNI